MTAPATATAMIGAEGLTKHYGNFRAAEDVTFSVPRGQVAAFLGPNGAGKSTTMKMLTGFLAPTRGTARIGGYDISQDRLEAARLIGYLPENGPLYTEMTPAAFLNYCGRVRGLGSDQLKRRVEFVTEKCSLAEVWGKPIAKLSRGFRQRVGMAQALLHDPDILILDEPTSGLDPNQTFQARELIASLGKTKTVLLSTHILREVEAVCERVILINDGRIVMDGPTADMAEGGDLETRFRELTAGVAA